MLDAIELSNRLRQCADGKCSIEELEGWFDSNSWNVHQLGDLRLVDTVFEFETLYTAYAEGRLSKKEMREAVGLLSSALLPVRRQNSDLTFIVHSRNQISYTSGTASIPLVYAHGYKSGSLPSLLHLQLA
jgi:hypothetical protein